MVRVCHLTSVHQAYDTRILLKECRSLANAGYKVHLVAPHHQDEVFDAVKIIAVKRNSNSRLFRALFFSWKIFFVGLKTQSKVYHFHDPELIPVGILLVLLGKKVIFDVHENVAKQIRLKEYLPFRQLFSKLYGLFDFISAKLFYLILAENSYKPIYENHTKKLETVLNMPDISLLSKFEQKVRPKNETIELYYLGGITFNRGIGIIIEALEILKDQGHQVKFHCIGPIENHVMKQIEGLEIYNQVKSTIRFYGAMRLDKALEFSMSCHIGLSVLLPVQNYLESYSTKIFEYMAIGLPVITSNFALYESVIEKYNCGICIDPLSPAELAQAIAKLSSSNELRMSMAKNGIDAAKNSFNWKVEEKKLLNVYRKLSGFND
ncbi:MAG: glycosyltransferase family 4 protein [Bacteroidota bacterium]